jgi:hypothetical protein
MASKTVILNLYKPTHDRFIVRFLLHRGCPEERLGYCHCPVWLATEGNRSSTLCETHRNVSVRLACQPPNNGTAYTLERDSIDGLARASATERGRSAAFTRFLQKMRLREMGKVRYIVDTTHP